MTSAAGRFTLYADDTGQPGIRLPTEPDNRHTFAYGGVVCPDAELLNMQRRWAAFREEFFGAGAEVKAEDFVRDDSPLPDISKTVDRRVLAQGMLAVVLDALELRPVACFVDKSRAPDLFITRTRKGHQQVDKKWPFEVVTMQFGMFLSVKDAHGCMVCDEPGQGKVEDGLTRFEALETSGPAAPYVSRIDSVSFDDSRDEAGLQSVRPPVMDYLRGKL